MLTTHLALVSFVFARGAGTRRARGTGAIRAVARRIRAALARSRRSRAVRYPPLSDHLRRDIGLDPLPWNPFGR